MAQVWLAQRASEARHSLGAGEQSIGWTSTRTARPIDERTLIVPATHVCFKKRPQDRHCALDEAVSRATGALLFLDDYQRTGSGPIDVHALGVDFMVTGCLKYLLAEAGVAFLYVRRGLDRATSSRRSPAGSDGSTRSRSRSMRSTGRRPPRVDSRAAHHRSRTHMRRSPHWRCSRASAIERLDSTRAAIDRALPSRRHRQRLRRAHAVRDRSTWSVGRRPEH